MQQVKEGNSLISQPTTGLAVVGSPHLTSNLSQQLMNLNLTLGAIPLELERR